MNPRKVQLLIGIAAALLGLGVVAPSLILYPSAGRYTVFLKLLMPRIDEPSVISIAGGILTLLLSGERLVGSILLLFSVVFPIVKLGVLWRAADDARFQSLDNVTLHLSEKLAKFSMLDVLVLALLVIAVKRLPGGSYVELGWGTVPFSVSVLLSMVVPHFLRPFAQSAQSAHSESSVS